MTRLTLALAFGAVLCSATPSPAGIVMPTFDASASLNLNTDTTLFDPSNTTQLNGLSPIVNPGESLATALTASTVGGSEFAYYWETISTYPNNYFDFYPAPVLVYDLGSLMTLDAVLLWQQPNTDNANQLRDFTVRLSATTDFSDSTAYNGTLGFDTTSGYQVTVSGGPVEFIQLTLNDNYFGIEPIGGDRVGFGQIRADAVVPEPSSMALGFMGVASTVVLVYVRWRRTTA